MKPIAHLYMDATAAIEELRLKAVQETVAVKVEMIVDLLKNIERRATGATDAAMLRIDELQTKTGGV